MAKTVIGIGNCSGANTDKFDTFGLTPRKASKVAAPIIEECYAHFECKIHDTALISRYNFFIFEVVKAQKAVTPRYPKTLHFRGNGLFIVSGTSLRLPSNV
jgi:flavin reductase (DIM6/NTAB) family NADH-FMN oxidoreductase RutF